jgi:glyoxylase-like metal-dependent hydrolase (beta-lactamase superfamily II)
MRLFFIPTPYGNFLVDTGYTKEYALNKETRLGGFYDALLPVYTSKKITLKERLAKRGILLSDISYLFISHYHPDHISGLSELTEIPWIFRKDALETLLTLNPLQALKHGFFSRFVPKDTPGDSILLKKSHFTQNYRGSPLLSAPLFPGIEAVDLPGHALGQMGLSIGDTFFVTDAAWSIESIKNEVLPSWLGLRLQQDPKAYIETFKAICNLQKRETELRCIPTHVMENL